MQEIFSAIEHGHRKILVRSCNGAGKTTALAALCLWKLSQFENSIVLTTASSWTQVTRSLWGEIRSLARRAGLFQEKDISATQIKLDDKHFAIGISPTIPENAQGFHAPHMLIAVDEATGVEREIIDALMGNATSKDAQIVLIYNPIDTTSFPFEAEETGDWKLITISAFEHPNVIEGHELIPGAVTREWIDDRLKSWSYFVEAPQDELEAQSCIYVPWQNQWYKKTAIVAARIFGEWPPEGGEGLIDLSLIRASRTVEAIPGEKCLGVDVARYGSDRTVFAFFNGNEQYPFEAFYGKDLMRTANRIKELYDQGWKTITIDDTGIGGGVTDRLRELDIQVNAVNFARQAKGILPSKPCVNSRTEMYFCLENELRRREVILVNDRELEQELTAIRLTFDDSMEAYGLESKERIIRRLGRSPDKADATALARYGLILARYAARPLVWF
jgi:phage terminase large subunit